MFRRIPVPQTPRESESCDVCFPVLPSRGLTFTQAVGVTSPRSHCPSVSVSPCSRLPPLWTGNRAPAFSWDGGCVGGVRARARQIGLRLFLLDIYIYLFSNIGGNIIVITLWIETSKDIPQVGVFFLGKVKESPIWLFRRRESMWGRC